MRKVMRKRGQRKPEVRLSAQAVAAVEDLDARVEMIQALIPMGLKAVEEELQRAVAELAGAGLSHRERRSLRPALAHDFPDRAHRQPPSSCRR